jgi:ABC-type multidrug transport system permease subunit
MVGGNNNILFIHRLSGLLKEKSGGIKLKNNPKHKNPDKIPSKSTGNKPIYPEKPLGPIKIKMRRINSLIKKEWKIFRIDKVNATMTMILPAMILILFALPTMGGGAPPDPINIIVVSNDSNAFKIDQNNATHFIEKEYNFTTNALDNYTIPFVEAVNTTYEIILTKWINTTISPYGMEEARNCLENGSVNAIIIIPTSFSELLANGLPGVVESIVDGSNVLEIQRTFNLLYDIIKNFEDTNNLTPSVTIEKSEYYSVPGEDPGTQMYNNALIGTLPFILVAISFVLTLLVVVREKTIPRLLLTPITRSELLLSKYIAYSVILFIQILLVFISSLAMGLYIAGSLFDYFLVLFLISMSGACIGMLISVIANTKSEANLYFFGLFLICLLLSGMFVSLDSMPVYLQILANMLPMCHGNPILTAVITKGTPISIKDIHVQSLLLISLACIVISFIIFKRKKFEV